MSVQRVGAGRVEHLVATRSETGEGPLWDEREQVLWWVDIPGRLLHRFDPVSGRDKAVATEQMVGAVALRESGGLLAAVEDGFAEIVDSRLNVRWPVEADRPRTRMNDGYCDELGRFWAGTMPLGERGPFCALYRLDPDGSVTTVLRDVGVSNGIDWSPDGHTMYYIDSFRETVDAFRVDMRSGTLAGRRTLIDYAGQKGHGDGLVVDEEGHLWVALSGGAAVHRYTPQGVLEMVIEMPVSFVTKPAFGGRDRGDLYITTGVGRYRDEPLAGDLFRVRGLGIRGQAIHRFRG